MTYIFTDMGGRVLETLECYDEDDAASRVGELSIEYGVPADEIIFEEGDEL